MGVSNLKSLMTKLGCVVQLPDSCMSDELIPLSNDCYVITFQLSNEGPVTS